jgi:hypothetical protein
MWVGLKLNGTHELLFYADYVNLLGNNRSHEENTETLINASEEVGLEVNAENTECMLPSLHQNAGQTDALKMWHSSYIWEVR